MSNIKLVWTQSGQILGDFESNRDWNASGGSYTVENAVFVSPGPQGLSMMPVLMFSEETKLVIERSELRFNGQLFEPLTELRNAYNEQFGAGIQLLR